MPLVKIAQDQILKLFFGNTFVPTELLELNKYFRNNSPINFVFEKNEDGLIVARSTNFRFGSIIAQGKNDEELDKNIKDAILTAFSIPSSFAKEAGIVSSAELKNQYAIA
jgi:hypothetical protein